MSVERVKQMLKDLHEITKQQDTLQLSIPKINESVAISLGMVNCANALILEASKWKGDIRPQVRYGYTLEKVQCIIHAWNAMAHDYNVSHEGKIPIIKYELIADITHEVPKQIQEHNLKIIFDKQDVLNK